MRIFFTASRMIFFYFRFFKIRTNCFSEDFHEILRAEKLFSCRATRIFINISSSWSSSSLCSFFEKSNFFTMMTELIFIAIDCESLTCCKHWRTASARNNLYYKRIFVSFYSARSKHIFFCSLKWIRSLFISWFIFEQSFILCSDLTQL